ncbi:phytoene/squalene synthase family protein [Chloroflexus aggregans]|uniref:Squalene/phytoene synthase n=1 Tax=Chloroflexus aggregans (strain MD-66 / DSM 9485) TaxID=326427 RepID=B8G6B8_CHLAD|nr:phytoene/squalene synthase family protein [Chloroflexus aggregans]ACL23855.1 Squalene/phytoene synthase [Chloroflexus aggregans DSM 9485]
MSLNSISVITRGNGLPVSQALPADEQLAQLFHLSDVPSSSSADQLPPPRVRSLAEAYAFCDEVIRRHSKSFFFSTQFLPPPQRRAVRALYAFCRTTDDTVDMARTDPARALAEWVRVARRPCLDTAHPVLLAWADTCQRYNLSPHLIDELLAGVAMDLTISRYATFADLWLYCYRVASVVGMLVIGITGAAPGATPYAIKLGVALQLTNILRDVGEDANRGRVYLPIDELARFGLTADDILARVYDERFIALMKFQIERTHRLYDESWPGIALLPPEVRLAVAAAARVYRGILDKIVANRYDSYNHRAYLSLREKVARLPGIWWDVHRLGR